MPRVCHFVVVDDDERTVFLVVRALKAAFPTSEVTTFLDGVDAIAHLRSSGSDCLITDQSMPRLNGEQLIAALRSEGIHIPAIMISNSPYAQAAATSVGVPLVDKGRIGLDLGDLATVLLDASRMSA